MVFSHELIENRDNDFELRLKSSLIRESGNALRPSASSALPDVGSSEPIQLKIVLEANYLSWKKNHVIEIPRSQLLPMGGSFTDIEEATNAGEIPADLLVSIDATLTFEQAERRILEEVWPHTKLFKKDPTQPLPYDRLMLWSPSTPTYGHSDVWVLAVADSILSIAMHLLWDIAERGDQDG